MKPLQIGLLIAAGAIGGGLIMKMTQTKRPEPVSAGTPAPAATQASTPAATPVPVPPAVPSTPALPAVQPPPADTPSAARQPSPFPEKSRKATRVARTVAPQSVPALVEMAQQSPTAVPQPAATPAPEPAKETPPPPAVAPTAPPAEPAAAPVPTPAPEPPARVTIKAGTLLPVRLVEGLSSDRNSAGDLFTATLDQPLVVDGYVLAERGARLEGRVVAVERAGRVKGLASLAIELTRLTTSDGQKLAIQTDSFERHAESTRAEDAGKVGAAAGIGAIIGAIAGGGKGAAIGAAAGGAAGTGGVMATRGKAATLRSETRINFRLREAITVTERRH